MHLGKKNDCARKRIERSFVWKTFSCIHQQLVNGCTSNCVTYGDYSHIFESLEFQPSTQSLKKQKL